MLYAFFAYFFWGFFPVYWRLLKHVPISEVLAHRLIWACIFYTLVLFIKNKKFVFYKPKSKKSFLILFFAALALMANWFVYIYSVNHNQVLEGSLGYFINPIVNIILGVTLLKEKLNRHQIISALTATIGVLVITFDQGHLPWIALFLAATFSFYGFSKKINSEATGLESNQFESVIFFPMALMYIIYLFSTSQTTWINSTEISPLQTSLLLMGAGVITGFPLVLFAEGARRLPYYMMGFFQFLAPTLQFIVGYFIFKEPLSQHKLLGFFIIWAAILYLIISNYFLNRKKIN